MRSEGRESRPGPPPPRVPIFPRSLHRRSGALSLADRPLTCGFVASAVKARGGRVEHPRVMMPDAVDTAPERGRRPLVLRGAPRRWLKTALDYLPRGQSLSEDVWRVRHRTLSYLLRAHVLGVFCFALIVGRGLTEALEGAAIVAVFACLASTDTRRRK